MFKECLRHAITTFVIANDMKLFCYVRCPLGLLAQVS